MSSPAFPWRTDRDLTDELARELIESQFPQLAPARVTNRAQGWDNEALEINGEWIFRFPKRADAALDLERELQLLPQIASRLPLAIPRYEFFGRATVAFPYLFAGYRKLSGTPATHIGELNEAAIAAQLGAFLSALHALDLDEFSDIEIPIETETPADYWPGVEAELSALTPHLGAPKIEACRAFLRTQERGFAVANARVLLHADLRDEHILLLPDGSHVAGIIDWTDAALGDAAHDFAGIWEWRGEAFAHRVHAFYAREAAQGFWERVRFYGLCATITTLDYAYKIGDQRLTTNELRALERALN